MNREVREERARQLREQRLLEAAKWALNALEVMATHPYDKDYLRAGTERLRAAIAEAES